MPREQNRIDVILGRLKVVWEQYPDLRLGQLILNVTNDPFLYHMEDEELLNLIEQTYASLKASDERVED